MDFLYKNNFLVTNAFLTIISRQGLMYYLQVGPKCIIPVRFVLIVVKLTDIEYRQQNMDRYASKEQRSERNL